MDSRFRTSSSTSLVSKLGPKRVIGLKLEEGAERRDEPWTAGVESPARVIGLSSVALAWSAAAALAAALGFVSTLSRAAGVAALHTDM